MLHIPPKRRLTFNGLHGNITQTIVILKKMASKLNHSLVIIVYTFEYKMGMETNLDKSAYINTFGTQLYACLCWLQVFFFNSKNSSLACYKIKHECSYVFSGGNVLWSEFINLLVFTGQRAQRNRQDLPCITPRARDLMDEKPSVFSEFSHVVIWVPVPC
jgi:hypothetical protein